MATMAGTLFFVILLLAAFDGLADAIGRIWRYSRSIGSARRAARQPRQARDSEDTAFWI